MNKFIAWLRANPIWNIIIVCIYYPLVVLPHEWVGLRTVDIFGGFTRDTYNAIILGIVLVGLAIYFIPLFRNIRKGTRQKQQWFYFGFTVLLATYLINALFVINIEVAHFLQYGIFAILCFPLVNNYLLTLIWVTLLGSIDEAYQYFYLAPFRTQYYDFNDVVTNLCGGAFGLVYLRSFEVQGEYVDVQAFLKSKTLWALVGCVLVYFGFLSTDILDLYPAEGVNPKKSDIYYMVKKIPESFWITVHPNVTYHVMLPLEGTLWTIGLWIMYRHVGRF